MSRTVQQARRLRKVATRHEKRLWWHLRDRKLSGLKFRRQVPIADRIVDFFCAEAHLAIELDGSGHCRHFTQTDDLDREIELHEKGIRVVRFYNSEIDENLDGVLNAILYAADPERSLWANGANKGPSPYSSPSGRGKLTSHAVEHPAFDRHPEFRHCVSAGLP